MKIALSLSVDEVNALLDMLGRTPTSSGAWPLLVKIKQTAEAQVAKQRQESDDG